jgi:hypothetical protein
MTAAQRANVEAFKAGGYRLHKWVTRGDAKVRSTHRRQAGQIVEIGKPFANGLLEPRDLNSKNLDEIMGCRCFTVPVRG